MKLEDPRCTSLGIYENKLFIDDISVEIFVHLNQFTSLPFHSSELDRKYKNKYYYLKVPRHPLTQYSIVC